MSIWFEDAVREMETVLDMWEFMAKITPYGDDWTKEDCLKHYGEVEVDGDPVLITNAAMASVVKLMRASQKAIKESENLNRDLRADIRILRDKLSKAKDYAAMSDPRIAGELDKQIQWYEANEGQEDLVYGPVELMGYCRDRLRSRR